MLELKAFRNRVGELRTGPADKASSSLWGEPDGRVFPQEGTKGDGSFKKKFADYIIRDLGLGIVET